ncbi:MAG TPA: cupin domain-containing protein [Puia sp.]|jgi:quercetin dioxygenase-like cupin family protein
MKKKSLLTGAIATIGLAALAIPGVVTAQQSPAIAQSPLTAQSQATAQQSPVHRTDLQRHDLSAPGREAIQVRVDIDPGATAPRHSHPGEEIIYVLEGLMEYHIDGQPPVTLKAGDVYFIPSRAIHSATNVGSTNAAELATYVVEKGKPLVVLAK